MRKYNFFDYFFSVFFQCFFTVRCCIFGTDTMYDRTAIDKLSCIEKQEESYKKKILLKIRRPDH